MKNEAELQPPIFSLSTHGSKCRSCVMPRLLVQDFRDWDHTHDGDLDEAIMQHVERRCGSCQDSVWAEQEDGFHFKISIYQKD
ncbi:hypothetical protein [Neorhizobium sp. P12A]|uniref:hypothetical protein n=1 Tax=Neorhizobium sp. P12A TaxID=2268027 RepID=UPI0011EFF9D5|nr:hypothetical protein [Neorhizobium sp. P12A]